MLIVRYRTALDTPSGFSLPVISRLTAGEGCFINTGVLHSFHAPEPGACHYHSFVFAPSIIGGMPGSIFDVAYVRPLLNSGIPFLKFEKDGSDTPFFQHFSSAYSACEEEIHGYEFKVRSAFSDLLLYILEELPAASSIPAAHAQEKRLKEALEWISENLETDISTETLTAASHISPRECQRMFQKYLHLSSTEYIRRQRIFLAADLLTATDEPVTEIGFRCGFSSPSYFSSEFRKIIEKRQRNTERDRHSSCLLSAYTHFPYYLVFIFKQSFLLHTNSHVPT